MDIVVSVFIGMLIGGMLAVVFSIAITSYRENQRDVSERFKAAKKENICATHRHSCPWAPASVRR